MTETHEDYLTLLGIINGEHSDLLKEMENIIIIVFHLSLHSLKIYYWPNSSKYIVK